MRRFEQDSRGLLWKLGGFGEFRQLGFAKLLQIGKAGRHDEGWSNAITATMRHSGL